MTPTPVFKVTLDFDAAPPHCRVEQDFGYRRAFRSGYTEGESWFYHAVARELRKQGFDVVKKLMFKDGHLVSEYQYYIREREGRWAIFYPSWSIRQTVEEFRWKGQVDLAVARFDPPIRPVFKNSRGDTLPGYAEWKKAQDEYWGVKESEA